MLYWIMENLGTDIVSVLLLAAIAAILVGMLRDRKNGKTSCGSGCSGCPMGDNCHQQKK